MITLRMVARTLGVGPRNELRRGSDRIETAVLWFALLTSLLMMPPGGVIALYGAVVGIGVFVCGLAGIWFVVALVRTALDRWRYARWQSEWRRVSPPVGRTTS